MLGPLKMNDAQTCRGIAIMNVVAGALVLIGVLFAIGGMIAASAYAVLPLLLTAVMGLVSVSLIHSAIQHLRSPSRTHALTNAANGALVIWFLVTWLLRNSSLRDSVGPAYVLLPLLVAFAAYRLILRPAARRAFPEPPAHV